MFTFFKKRPDYMSTTCCILSSLPNLSTNSFYTISQQYPNCIWINSSLIPVFFPSEWISQNYEVITSHFHIIPTFPPFPSGVPGNGQRWRWPTFTHRSTPPTRAEPDDLQVPEPTHNPHPYSTPTSQRDTPLLSSELGAVGCVSCQWQW